MGLSHQIIVYILTKYCDINLTSYRQTRYWTVNILNVSFFDKYFPSLKRQLLHLRLSDDFATFYLLDLSINGVGIKPKSGLRSTR
jgi:hypothetical protein